MRGCFERGIGGFKDVVDNKDTEETISKLIDEINKNRLNAFITVREEAIDDARKVDKDKGDKKGRLLGMPIAVKDNISTKGTETTCASKILKGYVPPFDATIIDKLKREGAIIIGKTNMDEFAMGSTTETSFFGPTLNPWKNDKVPGGSSGGSAAAVAAGECIAALGTDTGGSVRCPASFCGVVGIKPTYGLVSRYGLIAYANSVEGIGSMAASVKDAETVLDIISGKDPNDSTSISLEDRSNIINNHKIEKHKRKRKIGVLTTLFNDNGTDKDVLKCVWNAIHRLESLGIEYEEIDLPNIRYALPSYYIIAMSEASSNLARFDGTRYGLSLDESLDVNLDWDSTFSKVRGEGFGKEVKRRILMGTFALSAGYYGRYYLKALKIRSLIIKDFNDAFDKSGLYAIVTPTMPYKPFNLGEKVDDPVSMYLSDIFTVPVNLTGLPSLNITCGFSEGLPIGMQMIGKAFCESDIIEIAKIYESDTNYQKKVLELF